MYMSTHSLCISGGRGCRLSGYKDIPALSNITSLVAMPLFESSSSKHAAAALQPESPRPCRLKGRSAGCPNLDEIPSFYDNAYDPSSCSCPSRYSQGELARLGVLSLLRPNRLR